MARRVIEAPQRFQRESEMVVRIRQATVARKRLADEVDRHVISGGLNHEHAEIAQSADMPRVER
jgi:hypothetical protein